jgi:hypothetical protein
MDIQKKPNLLIIGAMKSGTTSLHEYLAEHPNIFMSELKEPFYFVEEQNLNKGNSWYMSLFSEAPGTANYIGESSTTYTFFPQYKNVAERIYEFNPNFRLIYVMRDPVERTISHYWHYVRWHGEKRDMLTAIKEDLHYQEVSNYYMQLSQYFALFPKEQIYTLTFEELIYEPELTISNIFSWLGLDNSFIPNNVHKKIHATPQSIQMIRGTGILNNFRYSKIWTKIQDFCPKFIKTVGRHLATKEITRDSVPIEQVKNFLRPIQQKQTSQLSELLSRDFHEWKTLYK